MRRVILTREPLCQIRVALPVGVDVAIVEAREAVEFRSVVAGESAMGQRVAIRMPDHLPGGSRVANEIAASRGIAPGTFGVPVPCLHEQVCILTVADDTPSGRVDAGNLVGAKKDVGGVAGHAIHGRTQRINGTEPVHDVTGSDVDLNRLSDGWAAPDQ